MDAIDDSILDLLERDGRTSMAELGRRVGLSRTATLARVQRLEADGVIRGYHAEVHHPDASATHAARVAVVLRDIDPNAYVRRLARAFPELEAAESVAGEFDLLLGFAAESATRLDAILDHINGWRETVRTTTFVVLTRYLQP